MGLLGDVKLRAFFEGRSQANLLVRPGGFHESEIKLLAEEFLSGKLVNMFLLEPKKGENSVSVDEVRSLRSKLSLGSYGAIDERRLVVVNAELRAPAQNALLKILEEPPKGLFFVLLAESGNFYLPTISSRCQVFFINNLEEDAAIDFLSKQVGVSEKDAKLLFLQAGGSDKKLIELAENPELREKSLEILKEAKEFLKASEFDKLVILKKYSTREALSEFIEAVMLVVEIAVKVSPASALRLGDLYEKLEGVYASIKANGNVKLESLGLVV